jgi:hypothetical protein
LKEVLHFYLFQWINHHLLEANSFNPFGLTVSLVCYSLFFSKHPFTRLVNRLIYSKNCLNLEWQTFLLGPFLRLPCLYRLEARKLYSFCFLIVVYFTREPLDSTFYLICIETASYYHLNLSQMISSSLSQLTLETNFFSFLGIIAETFEIYLELEPFQQVLVYSI